MREAGKNRVRGSNQEEMFAGTSVLLGLPLCMIRAVKWMDEVEEEKRQKVVHEGKRWTKSSTAPRKPAWWHRCRRVGPGKRQQQLLGCRSVSRQPTDCSKSCEYEVRPPYKMDDMVIPASCMGRLEPS